MCTAPQPHGWGAGCARVWAVLVGIPAVVCITGVCGDAVSVLPGGELAFRALLQCSDGRTSATARGFGVPGGVAQIGKAFRNEIAPRGGLIRQ